MGIVIHSDTGIIRCTVSCEPHLISKRDISYKLCLQCICGKPLTKHHPWTMVMRNECLHSLDVLWIKWLSMYNFADKGNTDNFSCCNSSHTGSRIFCHFSQYSNFSKIRRNWFLGKCWQGIFTHLSEYYTHLMTLIILNILYNPPLLSCQLSRVVRSSYNERLLSACSLLFRKLLDGWAKLMEVLWIEVLTAVAMKSCVFWDITPCSPSRNQPSFWRKMSPTSSESRNRAIK